MPSVPVHTLDKKSKGKIDLSDRVFGAEVNEGLMHDVLTAQLHSRRSGTAKTKTRAEVRGSSKKIWKQKGTGNARHGNRGAPTFVGGGKALGPVPHSHAYRPPRAMRLGAMRSALSLKLKEGKLTVVEAFQPKEAKTKEVAGVLGALEAKTSLIVDTKGNDTLRLGVRNLQGHAYLPPEGVNLYDVLRHDKLILTKDAALALDQRFGGGDA